MTIEEAAKKLDAEHRNKHWFHAVGIGIDKIFLYVLSLKLAPKYIREMTEFEGYRVMVVRMQRARPL